MSYVLPPNSEPSKILYIDSRDATSYLANLPSRDHTDGTITNERLTSYFSYQLKEKIEIPLNQRALISLNSATIPYSFYNIRHLINDTLTIRATRTDTNVSFENTLIIESGNYTAYTLGSVVENFVNNSVQDPANDIQYRISISFDLDKGKYEYIMSSVEDPTTKNYPPITLTFIFNTGVGVSDELTPHIELGFPAQIDFNISIPASTVPNTVAPVRKYSTNVVDVNGSIHGVYVRTNLVSNGTLDSQSGTFSSILARVPINVNAGGILFATPNNATHRSIVDLRYIDTLTIRLTDERNRLLDLNGLHYQIAIAVDFIYGEKKHVVPMGGLSQHQGYSYHRNKIPKNIQDLPLMDRKSLEKSKINIDENETK
tara:strand:+ start:455 stop:1570 length:1116 start_codon:yes stop_codon:yes gene_type:complete